MKKILLVILLGVTVFICLISGNAVPVMALTYHDVYKDFRDYVVTDFTGTDIMLNKDTFALNVYGSSFVTFNYKMSSCPSGIVDKSMALSTQLSTPDGSLITDKSLAIKLPCSTTYITREIDTSFYYLTDTEAQQIKDLITTDDTNYMRLIQSLYDNYDAAAYNGITIYFNNLEMRNYFYYEFNTTYYFDKLALDIQNFYLSGINATILTGGVTPGNTNIFLLVAYDSSDYYRIYNTDPTYSISRPRTKYIVDLGEKITAYGIGAGSYSVGEYLSAQYTKAIGVANTISNAVRYHLINYANTQQAFPGATTIPDWTYDTCAAWEIPCHLGNALVYLATDAPITSSIYSVVSNAWEVIANGLYAFSSIFGAEFDSDGNLIGGNIIGILIVVSLGILIITWGVNSDD